MDDQQLAQQLEKTGNLMERLNDQDWLKQNSETHCSGYAEAGAGLQPYVQQLKAVSPEAFNAQKRQVTVLSILLPVLHDWLESWELGASFEAVYAEAQGLLFRHLQKEATGQSEWIEKLLTEHPQDALAGRQEERAHVKEQLADMLRQEDWQMLAKVAAQDMEKRILLRAQAEKPISA